MATVVKKLTKREQLDKQLLETLSELGGGRLGEEDLEFGDKFTIPHMYAEDLGGAIDYLIGYRDMMEEGTNFSRTFPYKPWDGAVAVESAFQKYFGTKGVPRSSFFERPQMVSVPVGVNEIKQVMWGKINIPVFKGIIRLGSTQDSDGNMIFQVLVTAPKKYEKPVEGLFKMIRQELDLYSIYRGKSIDGSEMPNFIDLSQVDKEKLVFNDITLLQLESNIWTPIKMPDIVRSEGVDTRRTILLEGPWGTGKTEIGLVTAQLCDMVNRTFLLCNPKDNNVYEVLDFAAMYQPATVFIEDIDVLASEGDPRAVQKYLDKFDGLTAKGKDIMVIMTTNHKEKIHKGMLRPGRLDAVIHIGNLDQKPTEKLIKLFFNGDLGTVDFNKVYQALEGFTPAFVVETCRKVKLYSIGRTQGKPNTKYETMDFLAAAKEMRDHHNLHQHAGEGEATPTLDRALREVVLDALDKDVRIAYNEDDDAFTDVSRSDKTREKSDA